ncbi:MAG: tol-pal system protein YbgF, partial [Mariprofundaceae bacterium]
SALYATDQVQPAGHRIAAPILSPAKSYSKQTWWRFRVIPCAAIFAVGLTVGACAPKKENKDAWLTDKSSVMSSLEQTQISQIEQYTQLDSRIERIDEQLALHTEKLEKLENSIKTLNANMQKLESSSVFSSNEEAERDLAKKIEKIKADLNKIRYVPRQAESRVARTQASEKIEKDSYIVAYLALKSGDYEAASATFEKFLAAYPNDEYADQGYYWLGVSYYSQHSFSNAIAAFSKVVMDFPHGSKHKAALLKLAQVHQEQGSSEEARLFLERLLAEHPGSPEAKIAKERLDVLEPATGKSE